MCSSSFIAVELKSKIVGLYSEYSFCFQNIFEINVDASIVLEENQGKIFFHVSQQHYVVAS